MGYVSPFTICTFCFLALCALRRARVFYRSLASGVSRAGLSVHYNDTRVGIPAELGGDDLSIRRR